MQNWAIHSRASDGDLDPCHLFRVDVATDVYGHRQVHIHAHFLDTQGLILKNF